MRLANKVALLSGVGPGMGRATAALFAQEGAKVAIVARRQEHLTETLGRIQAAGGEAIAIPGDVAVRADADKAVRTAMDRWGRIDILYSGGGGFFEPARDFSEIDGAYWGQAIANTLDGAFNLAQGVRPIMKAQGGGSIVLIAASFSVRQEGNPAYAAGKGGIVGLAQSLAKEFHPESIRVNVVASGLIRGRLNDGPVATAGGRLARKGFPQDIAYAALYLASDEAAWVTGQVLTVDGGVDVGGRTLWQLER